MTDSTQAGTIDDAGLVIPPVTPFSEAGTFDEKSFLRLLGWFSESGVRRLLISGTTGEFFSLRREERRRTLLFARRHFQGTLLYHGGYSCFEDTREELKWAEDNGADAVMSLPPYYPAGLPEQGIVDYFEGLREVLAVPMYIYNFPKHTQNPMTPAILGRIRHAGVKDSSGDLSLIKATPRYLLGGDKKILEGYRLGAKGFVSASSNAAPGLYVQMERALEAKDEAKMATLQERIARVNDILSGPNAIRRIKLAMALQLNGFPDRVRTPLTDLPEEDCRRVRELVESGGIAP